MKKNVEKKMFVNFNFRVTHAPPHSPRNVVDTPAPLQQQLHRRTPHNRDKKHTPETCFTEHAKVLAAFFMAPCSSLPCWLPARCSSSVDASDVSRDCFGTASRKQVLKVASRSEHGKAFTRWLLRGSSVCWLVGWQKRGPNFVILEKNSVLEFQR